MTDALRERRSRVWRRPAILFPTAILLALLAGIYLYRRITRPEETRSIVVLPFESLGNGAQDDPFTEGLTDELITGLGQMRPELSVVSRMSAMRYRDRGKDLLQIGRELKVCYVLEGTVRHEGSRVRVSARLVHVADQSSIWAASYDRALGSALEIESDVAREVANSVRDTLSSDKKRGMPNNSGSSLLRRQFAPEPRFANQTTGTSRISAS